jgi:hypothetical protein
MSYWGGKEEEKVELHEKSDSFEGITGNTGEDDAQSITKQDDQGDARYQ